MAKFGKPEIYIITFGKKYKGRSIRLVPNNYLDWIIEQFNSGDIKEHAKLELNRRMKEGEFIPDERDCYQSNSNDFNDGLPF